MEWLIDIRRSIWAAALAGVLLATIHDAAEASQETYPAFWRFQGRLNWGLVEPTEAVLRSEGELRQLWVAIHSLPGTELPVPPPPEVDFSREMVIAIGMGRRGTGGYRIADTAIVDTGDRLRVFYVMHSPGSNCMTPQSITSPVELLRLARIDKPVTFAGGHVIRDCK